MAGEALTESAIYGNAVPGTGYHCDGGDPFEKGQIGFLSY